MTGVVEETFETPYTKEHRLGGREVGKGLKYFGCFVLNSCQQYGDDFFYEPLKAYRWWLCSCQASDNLIFHSSAVTTKPEFCNLTQINFKAPPARNESRQAAFYDHCMKNDHPNVFICPRSGPVFQTSSNTTADVKILETKLKEIKKKKKYRRKKRKNKRSKRKNRKRRNRKKRRNKGRFYL